MKFLHAKILTIIKVARERKERKKAIEIEKLTNEYETAIKNAEEYLEKGNYSDDELFKHIYELRMASIRLSQCQGTYSYCIQYF